MKREKIGLIGGSYYDVMPASNWHPDILTSRLGPSYTELDMTLLVRALDEVTNAEVSGLLRRLKNSGMRVFEGENSLDVIRMSARVSLAIERLQERYGLTGVAVNCYGGPDPEGYTGVLGCCGASGCLKAHALGSVIMGCESDVVQCAQQMLFRHLAGKGALHGRPLEGRRGERRTHGRAPAAAPRSSPATRRGSTSRRAR